MPGWIQGCTSPSIMLRRSLFLAAALSAATSFACSAPADDAATSADDITDVRHTPVKERTIGNCWLYASVASTSRSTSRRQSRDQDLSESYLTYWRWCRQIASFHPTDPGAGSRPAASSPSRPT